MALPKIAILIPHFQTPKLTTLCLRLLRRHTRIEDCEILAIDNGSRDNSSAMLEVIPWIRLIRRQPAANERPARSHGLALNLGVESSHAPFVLVMHTDTMILRDDWLDFLFDEMSAGGPQCSSVGSWKMESESWLRRIGKHLEATARKLRGKHRVERRYPRSHCALYRREALRSCPQMFDPGPQGAAGEFLEQTMQDSGWRSRLLAPEILGRYVCHLNHATMALNEEFGKTDRYMPRTRARSVRRIEKFFSAIGADEILQDAAPIA